MSNHENETDKNINETTVPRADDRSKHSVVFLFIGILIFVFAFSYGYFRLAKINLSLADTIKQMQIKSSETESRLAALQQSQNEIAQTTAKSQSLSNQQEQMIASWQAAQKGNLNKWYAHEAQYLVKLADDHLKLTHDTQAAVTFLERALQTLQNLTDENAQAIRAALTDHIAHLQASTSADVTTLFLQLSALDKQFDQLPLPETPLKASKTIAPSTDDFSSLPWWKQGLARSWQALRQVVIVRYETSNVLPLILPEEKVFLYQNLHAQMETAMWAVLHHNNKIYQDSLERVLAWLKKYFNQEAKETKTAITNIEVLQKSDLGVTPVSLTTTLQMFDQYFAEPVSTEQTKTAQ